MSVTATATTSDQSPLYDAAEWETRVQLAACYRLMPKFGMTDLIFTHVSARLPGKAGNFLLNPYGLMFDEITASSLVEVDPDGNVVGASEWGINWAGYIIHGAVLAGRPDVTCALHTHTRAGVAVSCLESGLLPISQHALAFHDRVAYHAYEGFADEHEECARLSADLGELNVLVMRNHGLLTTGETVGEAFVRMYFLEMACKIQIDAQSTGAPITPVSDQIREHVASDFNKPADGKNLAWEALLRGLDRTDPSYKT
jgi:ribulose-5-phosphate 4-epimerase/fuculose-1-phosphate aldolase